MTKQADIPGIIAWARNRPGAKPAPSPATNAAMNAAIDRLIKMGADFTVRDLPAGMAWPAASQRLSRLWQRGEVELVKESPKYGDWNNPRIWRKGSKQRMSWTEAGRLGAEASLRSKQARKKV